MRFKHQLSSNSQRLISILSSSNSPLRNNQLCKHPKGEPLGINPMPSAGLCSSCSDEVGGKPLFWALFDDRFVRLNSHPCPGRLHTGFRYHWHPKSRVAELNPCEMIRLIVFFGHALGLLFKEDTGFQSSQSRRFLLRYSSMVLHWLTSPPFTRLLLSLNDLKR